jgi:dihydrofolate reductase
VRKLIVSTFVTVDGVMEAPGGEPSHPHTGWVGDRFAPDIEERKRNEVLDAESLLLGRVTYESFAGAWPTYEGEMADKMNSMHKDVVSSTLRDPEWSNTTVLGSDVVAEVQRLKAGDGGPILVNGSATLVRTLVEHDLVDEYRLMVFPVSIGGGIRLFPETQKLSPLRLTDSQVFSTGAIELVYEPA